MGSVLQGKARAARLSAWWSRSSASRPHSMARCKATGGTAPSPRSLGGALGRMPHALQSCGRLAREAPSVCAAHCTQCAVERVRSARRRCAAACALRGPGVVAQMSEARLANFWAASSRCDAGAPTPTCAPRYLAYVATRASRKRPSRGGSTPRTASRSTWECSCATLALRLNANACSFRPRLLTQRRRSVELPNRRGPGLRTLSFGSALSQASYGSDRRPNPSSLRLRSTPPPLDFGPVLPANCRPSIHDLLRSGLPNVPKASPRSRGARSDPRTPPPTTRAQSLPLEEPCVFEGFGRTALISVSASPQHAFVQQHKGCEGLFTW